MFKSAGLSVLALVLTSAVAPFSSGAVAHAACPQVGFTFVEPQASSATRAVRVGRNQTIFVRRVPITTTSDIVTIRLVADDDDADNSASLLIKFTPAADQRLHEATSNVSGQRIAFMLDDEVLLNVVWEGPYGMYLGGTRVSIQHGMEPARKLMKAIRGCTGGTAASGTVR